MLRLPSALAAAATVPLTYALGSRLAGRRAGLYAAAAVGLSLPIVYWGQMARGYTLGAALAAASALALARARDRARASDAALFFVTSLALCWTLLVGALVVLVELATLLLPGARRGARRRLGVAALGVGAGAVPLALIALRRGTDQLFWMKRPNTAAVRSVGSFLAGAYYQPHEARSAELLLALFGALALGCLVGALVPPAGQGRAARFAAVLALGITILVPLALYVVSRVDHPVFIDRYCSPCLPAAALVAALPLARLRPAIVGHGALAVLLALRLGQLFPTYGTSPTLDDWRDATAAVLSLAAPGDCLAFDANDGVVDFSYYLAHRPADYPASRPLVSVLPAVGLGSDPVVVEQYRLPGGAELARLPARCPRLFLIESHDGGANGSPSGQRVHAAFVGFRGTLERAYASRTVRRFPGVSIYLFASPHHEGAK